jgi:hypothetical protein
MSYPLQHSDQGCGLGWALLPTLARCQVRSWPVLPRLRAPGLLDGNAWKLVQVGLVPLHGQQRVTFLREVTVGNLDDACHDALDVGSLLFADVTIVLLYYYYY